MESIGARVIQIERHSGVIVNDTFGIKANDGVANPLGLDVDSDEELGVLTNGVGGQRVYERSARMRFARESTPRLRYNPNRSQSSRKGSLSQQDSGSNDLNGLLVA